MSPAAPSAFFAEHLALLQRTAPLGPLLDLACGRGRHALWAAEAGLRVVALDRSRDALRELVAARGALSIAPVRADVETGRGPPFVEGCFGAVLVSRFLFRPLAGAIEAALHPGGLLLYETFTVHQRSLGYGPRNPAFLLEDGELPTLFPGLRCLAHREGLTRGERPMAEAGLAARKPG